MHNFEHAVGLGGKDFSGGGGADSGGPLSELGTRSVCEKGGAARVGSRAHAKEMCGRLWVVSACYRAWHILLTMVGLPFPPPPAARIK